MFSLYLFCCMQVSFLSAFFSLPLFFLSLIHSLYHHILHSVQRTLTDVSMFSPLLIKHTHIHKPHPTTTFFSQTIILNIVTHFLMFIYTSTNDTLQLKQIVLVLDADWKIHMEAYETENTLYISIINIIIKKACYATVYCEYITTKEVTGALLCFMLNNSFSCDHIHKLFPNMSQYICEYNKSPWIKCLLNVNTAVFHTLCFKSM